MFYVLYCILIINSVSLIFNIDIAFITLLLHFIAELCYSEEFCPKKKTQSTVKILCALKYYFKELKYNRYFEP